MIKSLEIYLVTDGNGKEAVEFYKNALNAELVSMTFYKEHVPECPKEREHLVLNAQLKIGHHRLMISDENPDFEYKHGYNMTACIIVDSIEEATTIYDRLAVGAKRIHMELQETFWSPAYANLEDKFGMMWQISTEIE
ncbi:VOC family protein [Aerococcaceae bacterium NML201209]|nr:VOC family protein [Aerococcaceae bacterium NML201209]MCW6663399.1 VOC family protein [Aerococcaceae bacterium NML190073]MCW6664716.1 VOC family protein [Aerococcaceae bacterium NML191219]MDO4775004.1 VOC family protein [Aerococcaceae bacterium]